MDKGNDIEEKANDSMNIMIKGVLLIFLAMSGNFLAELLGCRTQKLLSQNMWAKHIILLFSIYFAMGLVEDINPYQNIADTFFIWVLFLLFTKTTVTFTILILISLGSFYMFQNFYKYYDTKGVISDILKDRLLKVKKLFLTVIIMLIIIGFILYSRKQFLHRRGTFSIIHLIFGTLTCDYQEVGNL